MKMKFFQQDLERIPKGDTVFNIANQKDNLSKFRQEEIYSIILLLKLISTKESHLHIRKMLIRVLLISKEFNINRQQITLIYSHLQFFLKHNLLIKLFKPIQAHQIFINHFYHKDPFNLLSTNHHPQIIYLTITRKWLKITDKSTLTQKENTFILKMVMITSFREPEIKLMKLREDSMKSLPLRFKKLKEE